MICASSRFPHLHFGSGPLRALRKCKKLNAYWWRVARLLYYRYAFGREIPLSRKFARAIESIEKRQGSGDVPISRGAWNLEYRSGQWVFLRGLEEVNRYSIIAGYIHWLKPGGSVLDVGCGEGILAERLAAVSRYVGIDIADAAIESAAAKRRPYEEFLLADANNYVPQELFDAIVFNETLYYLEQPVAVARRYEKWLRPDGIFIASRCKGSARGNAILRQLKKRYLDIDEVTVTTRSGAWLISVFMAPPGRVLSDNKEGESQNGIERCHSL